MRRREFIAGLGSTAAWPVAARAQPAKRPTIGFFGSSASSYELAAAHEAGFETVGPLRVWGLRARAP